MFKKSQKLYSAMLIALLLVFLSVAPDTAKACEEAPQTLLSLYLQSDLIILADYEDGKVVKTEEESEYGTWVETAHTLRIVKVLKGQTDLEKVSFTESEYRPKPNADISPEDMEEDYYSHDESYVDITKIKVGDRYLYFLTKIEESDSYGLTDYMSAIKDVRKTLDIYEKSIDELKDISASKENQTEKLAEWLVKSIEEPVTREDGISDLAESLYGVTYGEEMDGEVAANTAFDKTFSIYASKVFEALNDSHNARISAVLYPMLQQAWFSEKPEYAHYGIAAILGSFDKPRLAIYTYNMLKSVSKDDTERRKVIMGFLSDVIGDSEMSDIYYSFIDADYVDDQAKPQTKEELKAKNELKATLLKNFDKRFQVMMARNFKPFEEKS